MSGVIPQELIEKIRIANDIVEVVQSYFPLKRSGSSFVALCPFHHEKTPSFHVHPVKQIFYCFGCHKGGDVFRFIQEYERVSFIEAVRRLAERAGITLSLDSSLVNTYNEEQRLRSNLRQLLEKVTLFWHKMLLESNEAAHAREYLYSRKLDINAIKTFRLGYAPKGWSSTFEWLIKQGFDIQLLEKAGLIIQKEDFSGYYDRFRDRIIFPICDEQGRVVGFSGRSLQQSDQIPKYINSPETLLFQKGKILFGLDKARQEIAKKGFAIICEGQIDLIRCHISGISNVVAPLGTALTKDHCSILRRYAKEIVLCFDADQAGQKAAARALDNILDTGLTIRVAVLPEPHDPDSFILEVGAEAFNSIINSAPSFFDWLIEWSAQQNNIARERGQITIIEDVGKAVIKTHDPVLIELVSKKLAVKLGLSVETIRNSFLRIKSSMAPGGLSEPIKEQKEQTNQTEASIEIENLSKLELWLLKVLIADPELTLWASEHIPLQWLQSPIVKKIVEKLYEQVFTSPVIDFPRLYREIEDEESRQLLSRLILESEPINRAATMLADIAKSLELKQIDEKIRQFRQKLNSPYLSHSEEQAILAELNELIKRRSELKNATFSLKP